jgi:hypothetical protein
MLESKSIHCLIMDSTHDVELFMEPTSDKELFRADVQHSWNWTSRMAGSHFCHPG